MLGEESLTGDLSSFVHRRRRTAFLQTSSTLRPEMIEKGFEKLAEMEGLEDSYYVTNMYMGRTPCRGFQTKFNCEEEEQVSEVELAFFEPTLFAKLRRLRGIDEDKFCSSFCTEVIDMGKSTMKSGQYFFCTCDSRFVMKTLVKEEAHRALFVMLPRLVEHFTKHSDSLLTPLLGLMQVNGKFVLIMPNLFVSRPEEGVKPVAKYDLKGLLLERKAETFQSSVLLDHDLVDRKELSSVRKDCAEAFLEILALDLALLEELDVMDYSMLIGVYRRKVDGAFVHERSVADWAVELQCNSELQPRTRSYHFKSYHNVLVACEMLDFLENKKMVPDRDVAMNVCKALVREGFLQHCVDAGKEFDDMFLFFVWNPRTVIAVDDRKSEKEWERILGAVCSTHLSSGIVACPATDYRGTLTLQNLQPNQQDQDLSTEMLANVTSVIFTFGLVDYLGVYDGKKRLESRLKSVVRENPTVIPPNKYAARFLKAFRVFFGLDEHPAETDRKEKEEPVHE